MGPKRREEKETVVYPASKRKAAPFKPQRPLKASRTEPTHTHSVALKTSSRTTSLDDNGDGTVNSRSGTVSKALSDISDTDDDLLLPDQQTGPKPKPLQRPIPSASRPAAHAKPLRAPSPAPSPPLFTSSEDEAEKKAPTPPRHERDRVSPLPSRSEAIPSIPQPLLIRLLHEHFVDKSTQIDKHAIQVLQKYMEVFVRESIERTRLAKRKAVEDGDAQPRDRGWLELADLEKVAPGIMLDF